MASMAFPAQLIFVRIFEPCILLLSALVSIYIAATAASCYAPDGAAMLDENQPCNSISGEYSMCCATNRTSDADQCLQNGLCYNPNGGYYWREGCTDPTWKSDACSPICRSGRTSPIYFIVSLVHAPLVNKAYKGCCSSHIS